MPPSRRESPERNHPKTNLSTSTHGEAIKQSEKYATSDREHAYSVSLALPGTGRPRSTPAAQSAHFCNREGTCTGSPGRIALHFPPVISQSLPRTTHMPGQRTDIGRFKTTENSPMPIEQAVWMHPEVMSGQLCFRDTRIPVSTLFNFLADGATVEEYLDDYDVHRDAFAAVMLAAGRLACEAAERQLPREPASAPARQRRYPQLPNRASAQQRE